MALMDELAALAADAQAFLDSSAVHKTKDDAATAAQAATTEAQVAAEASRADLEAIAQRIIDRVGKPPAPPAP